MKLNQNVMQISRHGVVSYKILLYHKSGHFSCLDTCFILYVRDFIFFYLKCMLHVVVGGKLQ